MLDSFPGKKVSLELVLGRALLKSDSFKAVYAAFEAIDVPFLRSRAGYDWQVTGSGSRMVNKNEPQSPFSPSQTISNAAGLGLSSAFSTGTAFDFKLTHGFTDLTFGMPITFPPYLETKATLDVRQDLLSNVLGYGARRAHQAGDLGREAAEKGFLDATESWALGLVQIYYSAWLAQSQARAAVETVARRARLVEVTQLKLRRGTAEQPDFLQVKSALNQARVQQGQAAQVLGDRWRGLVLSLKLPEDWLTLDPLEIPMELDAPVEAAQAACGEDPRKTSPAQTVATDQAFKQAEAARLTAERAGNANLPSLQLVGQLATNSIDGSDLGLTFAETFRATYPSWTLGLSLTVPLLRYAERAATSAAVAEFIRADALSAQAQANLKLDWLNGCSDLKRLTEAQEWLRQAHKDQAERAKAEETRFGLGRSQTLLVIQAQDEAAQADLLLRSSQVEHRLAAWKVNRLRGQVLSYLNDLKSRAEAPDAPTFSGI